MANLFNEFTPTQELEQSEDRLGGFQAFETDIYKGKIKAFYAGKSQAGAMSLTLVLDLGSGKEYRETLYITAKPTAEEAAKGRPGRNYFINKHTQKKAPLPGFTTANDICLVACEKELRELDTEEKIIKLYDYEAKKELPTAVQMVTEVLEKEIAVAIVKIVENKSQKNESTGEYDPTPETREVNSIEKVFHPEAKITLVEAREAVAAGKTPEPAFWDSWLKKNKGVTRDKRVIKDGQAAPPSGKQTKGPPAAGATTPKRSLFGNK